MYSDVKRSEIMPWILETERKLRAKMPLAVQKAKVLDGIPYTVRNGKWQPGPMDGICWWTNGFWPGTMLQMYVMTGDVLYLQEAERCERLLDAAFLDFDHLHHDAGFMWRLSSAARYDLDPNDMSRKRALAAATLLAGRYNPLGFIRAWNGEHAGLAIIDTMMNLPLLYWASRYTRDPRFGKIAMMHANTVIHCFVRADGSCHHIIKFDPDTLDILETPGGQGYAEGSAWSRGQGWALYGFILSYRHTGKQEYLNTAKAIARFFLSHIGEDGIPDADFRAPAEPVVKDNIAGSLAACGLLEIAKAVPEPEQAVFFDGAVRLLQSMESADADWSADSPAIFRRCTGAYHGERHRHCYMQYGDYFFIEAMNKLRGETYLFW